MEEEKYLTYIIPRNYEDSFITASGISFRSIMEGAMLAVLFIPVFIFIPIQLMYRLILIAIFSGSAFAFGMLGIKHSYLSEFILKLFKFKKSSQLVIKDDNFFEGIVIEKIIDDEQLEELENPKKKVSIDKKTVKDQK